MTKLVPVVKTTATGHQQRYWLAPESAKSTRELPVSTLAQEDVEPVVIEPKHVPIPHSYSRFGNRGLRWQSLPNGDMKTEAMARAEETALNEYDTYEDFENNHDGSIELDFYGQCASVTLRNIDSEVIGLYRHGMCSLLAYGLSEITDAPIVVFTSPDTGQGWQGHAGLAAAGDQVLDITGFQSYEDVKNDYPDTAEPVIMSSAEFLDLISTAGEDPFESLEDLERMVTMDFAEYVLSQHVEGY